MKLNITIQEIDPNTKTIEMDGGFGVIAEGEYKGLKFVKTKGQIKLLGFDEQFLNKITKEFYNTNEV